MVDFDKVDKQYCSEKCPIGIAKKEELLNSNNSAYDAAMDMYWFVEQCCRTCERYSNGECQTESDSCEIKR